MQYESERIEYKSQLTDEIYKEVIAFANTDGGIIYIGVDDQGNATGIDDVDGTYTRLTNGVRDAIRPDVTMFVRYVLQDNQVIRIEIGEGSYKPYYLKGKGLKPNGVYVRQGASSVQASPEQIRQMIKDSDGDVYEQMRALQQDLTFEEAAAAFKRYKVEFAEDKYIALGMRNVYDDQYTNLGNEIVKRHAFRRACGADVLHPVRPVSAYDENCGIRGCGEHHVQRCKGIWRLGVQAA